MLSVGGPVARPHATLPFPMGTRILGIAAVLVVAALMASSATLLGQVVSLREVSAMPSSNGLEAVGLPHFRGRVVVGVDGV